MVSTPSPSPCRHLCRFVEAVYDRALFLESTKYSQSQTAPRVAATEVLRIDIKGLNHFDMARPERSTQVYVAVGANLVIAVCKMIGSDQHHCRFSVWNFQRRYPGFHKKIRIDDPCEAPNGPQDFNRDPIAGYASRGRQLENRPLRFFRRPGPATQHFRRLGGPIAFKILR